PLNIRSTNARRKDVGSPTSPPEKRQFFQSADLSAADREWDSLADETRTSLALAPFWAAIGMPLQNFRSARLRRQRPQPARKRRVAGSVPAAPARVWAAYEQLRHPPRLRKPARSRGRLGSGHGDSMPLPIP